VKFELIDVRFESPTLHSGGRVYFEDSDPVPANANINSTEIQAKSTHSMNSRSASGVGLYHTVHTKHPTPVVTANPRVSFDTVATKLSSVSDDLIFEDMDSYLFFLRKILRKELDTGWKLYISAAFSRYLLKFDNVNTLT
jgi:hypothetical protein